MQAFNEPSRSKFKYTTDPSFITPRHEFQIYTMSTVFFSSVYDTFIYGFS